MTLLLTVFAAVAVTVIWYNTAGRMKLGTLALMLWGASLMWLVDVITEYIEVGAAYFTPAPADMLNDAYLGLSVIAVPTSVGYGASFGGLSALLSMLNSCASGVSAVNIDNGFGAGYLASMINHIGGTKQ